mgnify:CR=1 FL=1
MGHRHSRWTRKFYQKQVKKILALVKRKFRDGKIDIDKYLKICEELGEEPDPEKFPVEMSDFPYEVQLAFHIHDMMPDRWDGMSGFYLGKDWSSLTVLFDTYEIEDKQTILFFVKVIEGEHSSVINEEVKRKQDARQRQAKSGGKPGMSIKG